MDEIKTAFSHVFPRDLRAVDPSKKGYIFGENLRVYEDGSNQVLSFLRGTDKQARKALTDKLDAQGISYKVGDDFET